MIVCPMGLRLASGRDSSWVSRSLVIAIRHRSRGFLIVAILFDSSRLFVIATSLPRDTNLCFPRALVDLCSQVDSNSFD